MGYLSSHNVSEIKGKMLRELSLVWHSVELTFVVFKVLYFMQQVIMNCSLFCGSIDFEVNVGWYVLYYTQIYIYMYGHIDIC